ncbi:UNVERIFIED_CONTAM: Peroxidase 42 [Sesamum radiatum]|uniref:peroxidase n=1 Tax=Sesamum radiatum TaxID=300843 RepID=A0AAW2KI79_SESRA
MSSNSKTLFFFLAILYFSSLSAIAENEDPGLVMNYYRDSCPQAEDIIKEQVQLLYKRHKNTAFSWLRNIFHDCFVERDGRKSRADILEQHLPDHNESMSVVLERFANIGINTPGVVALLGSHSVAEPTVSSWFTGCTRKWIRRSTQPMLSICSTSAGCHPRPQGSAVSTDKRTKPFVKKMAKNQDYFFKEFARAITILSENNPLTGTKGEIRKQCNLANKLH